VIVKSWIGVGGATLKLGKKLYRNAILAFLFFFTFHPIAMAQSSPENVDSALKHAAEAIKAEPVFRANYNYIMTARVRLLLFWVGKDDVGGGYIRRGSLPDDPNSELIELVMGSDPAKAPRNINRWGAAMEVAQQAGAQKNSIDSSTFLGFMKTSKGNSVSEMQKELAREKQGGQFQFSAIVNQANHDGSIAKMVPFASDTDFTIHQFSDAEQMVYQRLENSTGRVRVMGGKNFESCGRAAGFLSSVSDLIDATLAGRQSGVMECYTYDGELFELTLESAKKVDHESVQLTLKDQQKKYQRTYNNLIRAHFSNFNRTTNKGGEFDLLLGTEGDLRGVPVQITYDPNWWFDVVLNLQTPEPSDSAAVGH
jgi:hypothetical protein